MTDDDVERVVDEERAHEDDDEREHLQDRADRADEHVERVSELFGRELVGDHLDVSRQERRDLGLYGGSVGTRRVADPDLLVLTWHSGDRLRARVVEQHENRAHRGVLLRGELRETDELGPLLAARRDQRVLVAEREVVVVGGTGRQCELCRAHRTPTVDEHPVREPVGLAPVGCGERGSDGLDDLAFPVDRYGSAVDEDLPLDLVDAVEVADQPREVGRNSQIVAAVAEADLLAHYEIVAFVDVGAERAERGAEAVGEHEARDGDADAEHDRAGGEEQAQLAREQALECDTEHRQSPRCFMRSSTDCAVGFWISSTTRPSARNTTRSA